VEFFRQEIKKKFSCKLNGSAMPSSGALDDGWMDGFFVRIAEL
jgi:hypothetical protein